MINLVKPCRTVSCSAVSQAASPDTERAGSSGRGIEYTSYEANSWSCLFRQSGRLQAFPGSILIEPVASMCLTPLICGLSLPWSHAGVKILVDPWLVDELTFAGQRWLYRGKKTHISPVDPNELAKGCDAVVLSQVEYLTSHILLADFCPLGLRCLT